MVGEAWWAVVLLARRLGRQPAHSIVLMSWCQTPACPPVGATAAAATKKLATMVVICAACPGRLIRRLMTGLVRISGVQTLAVIDSAKKGVAVQGC